MDSDAIGPLLAVGGAALALLGRRRRATHDAPTVGERASGTTNEAIDAVTGTAQKAGTGITDLSVTGTAMVMGTTVAGAAGVARAAGHATTTVVTGVVELVGHGASRSGGLVLDGGVFLLDGLVAPLRGRRRTPAPWATPAARLVVAPAPVEPAPEPPAPAKKAPAKKTAAKKKAPAKKAPAKRARQEDGGEEGSGQEDGGEQAPAKKATATRAGPGRPPRHRPPTSSARAVTNAEMGGRR